MGKLRRICAGDDAVSGEIISVGAVGSDSVDEQSSVRTELSMLAKTPYTTVLLRNIKVMTILAKINMKNIYNSLGEKNKKYSRQVKLFEDDEIIDEIEQNRINEQIEITLNQKI